MSTHDVSFRMGDQTYALTQTQFARLTPEAQAAITSGGELTAEEAVTLLQGAVGVDRTAKHRAMLFGAADVRLDRTLQRLNVAVGAFAEDRRDEVRLLHTNQDAVNANARRVTNGLTQTRHAVDGLGVAIDNWASSDRAAAAADSTYRRQYATAEKQAQRDRTLKILSGGVDLIAGAIALAGVFKAGLALGERIDKISDVAEGVAGGAAIAGRPNAMLESIAALNGKVETLRADIDGIQDAAIRERLIAIMDGVKSLIDEVRSLAESQQTLGELAPNDPLMAVAAERITQAASGLMEIGRTLAHHQALYQAMSAGSPAALAPATPARELFDALVADPSLRAAFVICREDEKRIDYRQGMATDQGDRTTRRMVVPAEGPAGDRARAWLEAHGLDSESGWLPGSGDLLTLGVDGEAALATLLPVTRRVTTVTVTATNSDGYHYAQSFPVAAWESDRQRVLDEAMASTDRQAPRSGPGRRGSL